LAKQKDFFEVTIVNYSKTIIFTTQATFFEGRVYKKGVRQAHLLLTYKNGITMSTVEFNHRFMCLEPLLLSFAKSLTRDEDSARDLFQETAYKAYRYKEKFHPSTNFKAWLMTIMKNTFINDYRRKKRRQTIFDNTDNDFLLNSIIEVENRGDGNIIQDEVQLAIEALDEQLRVPFLLQFQGYQYEEIAERLEIPLGTVKSRIHFARKKLRHQLEKWYLAQHTDDILRA
jgi:RNA polymerase sigma-70 factor (ECF subfamily)